MMKKEEIIKVIEKNKKELNADYHIRLEKDNQGIGIGIHKKKLKVIYRISIWIDNQNAYTMFVPAINLTIIEEIVQPIFAKYKYKNTYSEETFTTISLRSAAPDIFTQTQPTGLPKIINVERDVQELFKILNEYIVNVAEPFFEKWGDIKFLNDYITTLPQKSISTIITDGAFKKAAIYRLCNNPAYTEYINWIYTGLVNKYEQNKSDDIAYKRNAEIITELKEVLDNTALLTVADD
jgi:hypothetical protein